MKNMLKLENPIQEVGTENIILQDPFLVNAEKKDIEFLLGKNPTGYAPQQILNPYRFLAHFYTTAGIARPSEAVPYEDSWERSGDNNFRAHMFGHYMSALALASRATDDANLKKEINEKLAISVTELTKIQVAYTKKYPERAGYIAPFGDVRLDEIDGLTGGVGASQGTVFVPWYNLHKILAGLLDIYKHVDNPEIAQPALELAKGFGNYFYNVRVINYDNDKKNKMLATEYGGMNDAFYELYNLTANSNYRKCAEMFDEVSLFDELAKGNNVLPGRHANTQIPKFIGALKRYSTISQNENYLNDLTNTEREELPKYLIATQNFFDIVVNNHSYITGGNSCDEHFHQPNKLASMINRDATHETCNTHNMLKLARELYKITGEKKYADYYENAFINGILSSQHPETGEMMYFHPMGAGYYKLFRHGLFWCCTGTGVENFVKLGDSIYFKNENAIYINMYFSSTYSCKKQNIKIVQNANLLSGGTVEITVAPLIGDELNTEKNLSLRIPEWSENPLINVENGTYTKELGYFVIKNIKKNTTINLKFPMQASVDRLADNKNVMAFKYGPFVLSANLGNKDMDATNPNGIMVLVPVRDAQSRDVIRVINGQTVDEWINDFSKNFVKIESDTPVFKLIGTDAFDLYYTPHFQKYDERYGLYMTFTDPETELFEQKLREKERLSRLEMEGASAFLDNFDNHAYEAGYNLQEFGTSTAQWMGKSCRHGQGEEAWFSYDLPIVRGIKNYLNTTVAKVNSDRTWDIYINDEKIAEQEISDEGVPVSEMFYLSTMEIPVEFLQEDKITVKYASTGAWLGGIFGISITQEKEQ